MAVERGHLCILYGAASSETDENTAIANEYGKLENIQSIAQLFTNLGYSVHLQSITLDYIECTIKSLSSLNYIILNLCDGNDAVDGYPGLSVIQQLELHNLSFSGSNSEFYRNTVSKLHMKALFKDSSIPTSPFIELSRKYLLEAESLLKAESFLGYPLIIKPDISYASIGIDEDSVILDRNAFELKTKSLQWKNRFFVEKFLAGREYTVLVTGDSTNLFVYEAAERLFDPALPSHERILAFKKYWNGYSIDSCSKQVICPSSPAQFYQYQLASSDVQQQLKQLASRAYLSVKGHGYGRVDIRSCFNSDGIETFYVLEVNANCGISCDDLTSAGKILQLSGVSFENFFLSLLPNK